MLIEIKLNINFKIVNIQVSDDIVIVDCFIGLDKGDRTYLINSKDGTIVDSLENKRCILDSINKIQNYSGPYQNADDFYSDTKTFDAVMMNFVVIGEMADKLSEEFKDETSEKVNWLRIKGFRNIIAHNYFGIDAEEVWQIMNSSLLDLKTELNKIISR